MHSTCTGGCTRISMRTRYQGRATSDPKSARARCTPARFHKWERRLSSTVRRNSHLCRKDAVRPFFDRVSGNASVFAARASGAKFTTNGFEVHHRSDNVCVPSYTVFRPRAARRRIRRWRCSAVIVAALSASSRAYCGPNVIGEDALWIVALLP